MNSQNPLCVDLDGTLIKTDLFLESLLLLVAKRPLYLLLIPIWIIQGRAYAKTKVASLVDINEKALPYNQELLHYLTQQKQHGRKLYLVTGAAHSLAKKVAGHLAVFEETFATSEQINLVGKNKAKHLESKFGHAGFDYIADSWTDRKVWMVADKAILVNHNPWLEKFVPNQQKTFSAKRFSIKTWVKAIRVHQWVKNILIFVPLFLSQQYKDAVVLQEGLLAFIAFSLCASSVYLLNDLLDIEHDRLHHLKKNRPLARGDISIVSAAMGTIFFALGGFVLAFTTMPPTFMIVLLTYLVLTLLYSFKLKKIVLVDVFSLAILYTVRIIAGHEASGVEYSPWLLAFSMFIFLSLAFLKRYSELHNLKSLGKGQKVRGRGYTIEDLDQVRSLGSACGVTSVLILSLYITGPKVLLLYTHPERLWPACLPILYWISRLWFLANRGLMHEDPIVFAVKDSISYLCGLLVLIFVFSAIGFPTNFMVN